MWGASLVTARVARAGIRSQTPAELPAPKSTVVALAATKLDSGLSRVKLSPPFCYLA